jgi:hypothetical protein
VVNLYLALFLIGLGFYIAYVVGKSDFSQPAYKPTELDSNPIVGGVPANESVVVNELGVNDSFNTSLAGASYRADCEKELRQLGLSINSLHQIDKVYAELKQKWQLDNFISDPSMYKTAVNVNGDLDDAYERITSNMEDLKMIAMNCVPPHIKQSENNWFVVLNFLSHNAQKIIIGIVCGLFVALTSHSAIAFIFIVTVFTVAATFELPLVVFGGIVGAIVVLGLICMKVFFGLLEM